MKEVERTKLEFLLCSYDLGQVAWISMLPVPYLNAHTHNPFVELNVSMYINAHIIGACWM